MRPAVVLLGLALVAAGCGADDSSDSGGAPAPFADLRVTVDKDGDGGTAAKTVTVRCGPASDSRECAALAEMKASAFRPAPGTVACTEQYGGPQVATVKGTLHGKPVDARLSRTNGCEIARWNKAADVLGAAG
jgi:hypothetical protein